jgi:hypothetical protein
MTEQTEQTYFVKKSNLIQKVVNPRKLASDELGDCATASLKLYFKLKNAGAVRYRGKRDTERRADAERPDDEPHYHFWVESKGKVFEEHCGVLQILSKEDFYGVGRITDAVECDINGFHRSELPDTKEARRMVKNADDKCLLRLIINMCLKSGDTEDDVREDWITPLKHLKK